MATTCIDFRRSLASALLRLRITPAATSDCGKTITGLVSKETVVLRRWGIETNVLFYQQRC